MTNGVVPVVTVMLGVLTLDFLKKSKNSLGWKIGGIIFAASIIGILILQLHPGIIIAALLAVALILPVKKGEKQ